MDQDITHKHARGWAAVADFVAKGKKEHALGMYKLLAHTMDDKPHARQIEADMLLAFSDPAALQKYEDAAKLYHKDGRMQEAIALYKVLISLHPDEQRYKDALEGLDL